MKKYKKYANIISFFYNKSKIDNLVTIKKIKKIKKGFINENYYIKLNNNNSFQLRKASLINIFNRKKERECLEIICKDEIIFYDNNTGDMIRKWFDGHIVKFWNKKLLEKMSIEIKKYQKYNISEIKDHDNFEYINYWDNQEEKELYVSLVKKYENEIKVFCHNDLTKNNILLNKDKIIKIIDFEFARYNSIYWEFANFAKDNLNFSNIKKLININNFNYKKFFEFLVITTIHAIQWTFSMKTTIKIIFYRRLMKNKLKFYKKELTKKIN